IHMNAVDEQLGDGSSEGENSGEIGDGPSEGEEPSESKNVIVTSYDDLLLEIGYDKDKKEEVKSDLRKALNEALTDVIQDKGVDDYMGYYKFLFLGMLAFIGPWVILFLFSFFHLLAKNKRFTMWYVKLICWIPPVIWLALKLLPMLANKFFSDVWNGEYGAVIKSIVSSISSFTWISGLCYILLWLVSIFWAFPIKRKIRKERKNPEVEDAYDDDYGDY
ncbi:MAG: hypothetical protein K2N23_07685, partial [Clostridia bacterium]|nr:hypothetical protein [Clostridia bacterium]